jgi:hypothetical protein
MLDSFSQRERFAGPPPGTLYRDEVPTSFRVFLLNCPKWDDWNKPPSPLLLQKVIVEVSQDWPTLGPPYDPCAKYLKECAWFRIFDIIEGLFRHLEEESRRTIKYGVSLSYGFQDDMNVALIAHNIGWKLENGKIVMRGSEAFEKSMTAARDVLSAQRKPTAARHLHNAIAALSIRPHSDTAGAVAHATNAVECVLGEITGQALTLGAYLDKNPNLFHPALKKGLNGVYGYVSDEGARHGREGTEPTVEDAEFAVAVCAAVCTLLTRKHPK